MSAPGEPTLAVPVSPPGRGAVALIHVSGAQARAVVERLLESGRLPAPDRARHAWLVDAAGERLDDALLVTEDAGTAFTGLPLVELGIHGGPAVRDAVLRALEQAGARPGDWKALLAQAWRTGARDAICLAAHRRLARTDSRTGTAILVRALNGELQALVRGVLERGDPGELRAFAEASRRASVWFRPLRVVLIGPPNAGKSTLFNALLGWERATVSGEAGTTRDSVEEDILLDDRPVRLVDTAGGRSAAVPGARIRDREVRIHVVDATARPGPGAELPDEGGRGGSLVPVVNKVDRLDPGERRRLPPGRLAVSALSGEGLEALAAAVFGAADGSPARPPSEVGSEPVLFTRRDLRLLEAVTGPDAVARGAREELRARTRPRRSARA